jgi:hypothetical protein
VDVIHYPMGRCQLHIPGMKNRGGFLQQGFLHQQAQNQVFFYKRGEGLKETGFP